MGIPAGVLSAKPFALTLEPKLGSNGVSVFSSITTLAKNLSASSFVGNFFVLTSLFLPSLYRTTQPSLVWSTLFSLTSTDSSISAAGFSYR